MRFLLTLIVVVVLLAAGAAAVIFTGAYNVAADDPHTAPVRWLLATARVNSVQARAEAAAVLADLEAPERIAAGARLYAERCAACHGTPGAEPPEWARRMQPAPPAMDHAARFWAPHQIHWIIAHGFKATGMPAWREVLPEDALWALTAYVAATPGMTAADYDSLTAAEDAAE
ncbi:cytochrome c [Caenispirillum bisanense]|uniref:c-type cytochrome n=1 Tax=Caenispirillum bisanense TaxID=414052 RepID=UPI0031D99168